MPVLRSPAPRAGNLRSSCLSFEGFRGNCFCDDTITPKASLTPTRLFTALDLPHETGTWEIPWSSNPQPSMCNPHTFLSPLMLASPMKSSHHSLSLLLPWHLQCRTGKVVCWRGSVCPRSWPDWGPGGESAPCLVGCCQAWSVVEARETAVQEIIMACSKIKSLVGVRERIKGAVCR